MGNVFDLTEPCDSDLEVSAQSDQECPGPALPVLVLDPVSYILTVSPWHTVTLAHWQTAAVDKHGAWLVLSDHVQLVSISVSKMVKISLIYSYNEML